MTVYATESGGVLKIGGDLDIGAAESLHRILAEYLSRAPAVGIDLSEVGTCDTAAVQLLLSARRTASCGDKPFRIVALSQAFAEIAAALGVDLLPQIAGAVASRDAS